MTNLFNNLGVPVPIRVTITWFSGFYVPLNDWIHTVEKLNKNKPCWLGGQ